MVAGLLALGFLPVLWARAIRLTRQRLQIQIPVSMQEILADRDHLRAEFAVARRKLEQEMERVRNSKAQDMGELGRRAAEILSLSETVAALHAAGAMREAETAGLARELSEERAQAGALQVGLYQAQAGLEQQREEYEALRRAHDALDGIAEERRLTVAALHTRTMGLEMTIEDAQRARAALERQAAAVRPLEDGPDLPSDLAGAHGRIRHLEAAVQEAKEREKGIHLQKSLQAERARGSSRADLDKVEALQAEVAALRGALEAARQTSGPGEAPATANDAALRTAIHDLGLAVARMGGAADDAAPPRPGTAAPSLV